MVEDEKRKGLIDSDLSLSERILETYYRTGVMLGENLKPLPFYKNELFKIGEELKLQIDKGADPEKAIYSYMASKKFVDEDITLTESLISDEYNCCSSTSLYLILAEMLDNDLFRKYHIGVLPDHIIIRKMEGENYKNIDMDVSLPDRHYERISSKSIRTLPKELIIANILSNAGVEFRRNGEYKKAIIFFDEAIQMDSEDAYLRYNKGLALYYNEEYSKAIEAYEVSLEIDPKYAPIWGNRGCVLHCLERYDEAIESYDKALEINPDYELVKQNKKIALSEMEFKGIKL